MSPIALTSDFGTTDPFVGIMKGVIACIAPKMPLIDITHAIPPGDIQRGAITLWQAAPHFPAGTIFLAVVDPGVGTSRRAIILRAQEKFFVGPDNGLFSYILAEDEDAHAWEIKIPETSSSTFHGRDVFAPAAAYLAVGKEPSQLGSECQGLVQLPTPIMELTPFKGSSRSEQTNELRGEILTQDQFGNALTSLGRFTPTRDEALRLIPWQGKSIPVVKCSPTKMALKLPDGQILPLVETFSLIPPDKCAVIVGSTGLLEIVANGQSAVELLNLKRGMEVRLQYSVFNQG